MNTLIVKTKPQSAIVNCITMMITALESSVPPVWIGALIMGTSFSGFVAATFFAFFS